MGATPLAGVVRIAFLAGALLVALACAPVASAGAAQQPSMYSVSYWGNRIDAYGRNVDSGALKSLNSLKAAGPQYATIAPDGRHLWTVDNRGFHGSYGIGGAVAQWDEAVLDTVALNDDGSLVDRPYTDRGGWGPWGQIAVSPDGRSFGIITYGIGPMVHAGKLDPESGGFAFPEYTDDEFKDDKWPDGAGIGAAGLIFSADSKYLFVAAQARDRTTLYSFELLPDRRLRLAATASLDGVQSGTAQMTLTPDGRRLYYAMHDGGTINGYAVEDGRFKPIGQWKAGAGLSGLQVTPNGKYLLSAQDDSHELKSWNISSDGGLRSIGSAGYSHSGRGLAITPDSRFVYLGTDSGTQYAYKVAPEDGTLTRASEGEAPTDGGGDPVVRPIQSPTAKLTTSEGAKMAGETVRFDASGSTGERAPLRYHFDFGDGNTLDTTAAEVTHVYEREGTRNATVTVTDANGCSDSVIQTGRWASCNGNSQARASAKVDVSRERFSVSPEVASPMSDTEVGQRSAAQRFTVEDHATYEQGRDFQVAASIEGSDRGDFEIAEDGCKGERRANCDLGVVFNPRSPGRKTAALRIVVRSGPDHGITRTFERSLSGTGTRAAASVAPPKLEFNAQDTQDDAQVRDLNVHNTGNVTLDLSGSRAEGDDAAQFSADAGDCRALDPDHTCKLKVGFKPTSPGEKQTLLVVRTAEGRKLAEAPLTGKGIRRAIQVIPAAKDFGVQQVGEASQPASLQVKNTGSVPVQVAQVSIPGADAEQFVVSKGDCGKLDPGVHCTATVRFKPTRSGDVSASLEVDAGGHARATVSLDGAGTKTHIAADPASLAFGVQENGSESEKRTVTVTNDGNVDVTIDHLRLAGPAADQYLLDGAGCDLLKAGQHCAVTVQFAPKSSGAKDARIEIADSGTPAAVDVPLSGSGVHSALTVDPDSADFAHQEIGTASDARHFAVINSGDAKLKLEQPAVEGTDAGQFVRTGDGCEQLAPGERCTVDVSFKPTSRGAKTARLQLASSNGRTRAAAALAGTGVQTQLDIDPTEHAFGTVPVGESTEPFEFDVRNAGSEDVDINSVRISGDDAAQFGLADDECTQLKPDQTCRVEVRYRPSARGDHQATLTVGERGGRATVQAKLSGNGAQASLRAQPGHVEFDPQQVDTETSPRSIEVRNDGEVALQLDRPKIEGSERNDFALGSDDCESLEPGDICSVDVKFAPRARGEKTATLVVASGNTRADVSLSGSGFGRSLAITPDAEDFGKHVVDSESKPERFQVENTGDVDVDVERELGGSDPGQFELLSSDCGVLVPRSGCEITARFKPTSTGDKSATLRVSDAGRAPTAISKLTGAGVERPPAPKPDGGGGSNGGGGTGGGGANGGSASGQSATAQFAIVKIRSRRGRLYVTLACTGSRRCAGGMRAITRMPNNGGKRRKLVVGKRRFNVASGGRSTVPMRLNRRKTAKLRQAYPSSRRTLPIQVRATVGKVTRIRSKLVRIR